MNIECKVIYLKRKKTNGISANKNSRWNTLLLMCNQRVTLPLRDGRIGSIKHTGVTPAATTRESYPFSMCIVTRGRRLATPNTRRSGGKFRIWPFSIAASRSPVQHGGCAATRSAVPHARRFGRTHVWYNNIIAIRSSKK